jgi:hypothetical protein
MDKNLEKEFNLARRRCGGVINLDVNPPIHHTAIKASTALAEIDRLEKLFKEAMDSTIQQERHRIAQGIELFMDTYDRHNKSFHTDTFIKFIMEQ